jgi:hypothetical protein
MERQDVWGIPQDRIWFLHVHLGQGFWE